MGSGQRQGGGRGQGGVKSKRSERGTKRKAESNQMSADKALMEERAVRYCKAALTLEDHEMRPSVIQAFHTGRVGATTGNNIKLAFTGRANAIPHIVKHSLCAIMQGLIARKAAVRKEAGDGVVAIASGNRRDSAAVVERLFDAAIEAGLINEGKAQQIENLLPGVLADMAEERQEMGEGGSGSGDSRADDDYELSDGGRAGDGDEYSGGDDGTQSLAARAQEGPRKRGPARRADDFLEDDFLEVRVCV